MRKFLIIYLLALTIFPGVSMAQLDNVHQRSTKYDWPKDPKVLEKLDEWQDLKFGVLIHWGLYAVPGIIESWELCSEDWLNRPDSMTYQQYKDWYWGLKDEFNPVNFNPEQWATAAKNAGMKYVVFTTKHHDGFNMFDTKQTDYKITNGPFADNPRSNVAKYVFEAFRKEDMMIGAYFSKPDWHSQYFWWDKYATPNRNVNYDIRKHPERWQKFQDFTYNQIQELMTGYGDIDILWLDGGWVRPKETVNEEVLSWGAPIPEWDQKIDMPKIANMARDKQPGILIVDRTVHGPYENYQTPERTIPEDQLQNPWESNIPLRNNWGYVPNDQAKSINKMIHSLVEIVAKGGSFVLGIGPKPDGTLRDEDIELMEVMGKWLETNGDAIYNTRITENYQDGNTFFTKGKEGELYALVNLEEGKDIPTTISWIGNIPAKGSKITFLSSGGSRVKYKVSGDKVTVTLPSSFIKNNKNYATLAFEFKAAE
ncbi:alpha-L-fucosidase [Chondrinema litorale]|uniref:alpha-L-fucosidase n=1 Tax=Chondrinema litorale TaxID=2994555 RepID=UPI00254290D0|nr:alpha-L-fucosidase [Chondrinema litorale]UZR97497.1 alpha-L-fucosidase [Chondrinema litorale]